VNLPIHLSAAMERDGEGIMEQEVFWSRPGTGIGAGRKPAAKTRRRSRPLNRFQEAVVLVVVFAAGVGLQLALLMHLGPVAQ
jgi:hypothetical protein